MIANRKQLLSSMGCAFFTILAVSFGSGCDSSNSGGGGGSADAQSSDSSLHAMYNSDVAGLSSLDDSALASWDNQNKQILTQIFGGPTSADIVRYYSDRVQYAFTENEINQAQLTPSQFQNQGWLQPPVSPDNNGNDNPQPDNDPNNNNDPSSSIQLGALNVSTQLWLEGIVNSTSVSLSVAGQFISIDSTRDGVIMMGDGYVPTIKDDQGNEISIPAAHRQAILIHEARHSDCTDGVTQDELAIMRNATSIIDYEQQVRPHCGHLHFFCPSGTYEGLAACDAERYGAYTIGALFEAALVTDQTDDQSFAIIKADVTDYLSRYIGSFDPSNPDEKAPNMTSEGLQP